MEPAIALLALIGFLVAVGWLFGWRPSDEETYCDGCKKFSRGNVCPYCPDFRRNDGPIR